MPIRTCMLKQDDEEAGPTLGLHKRLCRCNTQGRAGAQAALVFHRITNVVKAATAVRRSPAAIHMKITAAHTRTRTRTRTRTHTHTHAHAHTAVHCHLRQHCGCNEEDAAAVQLSTNSDQQYQEVKASEIQLT